MDKEAFIKILKGGSNKLEYRNLLVSSCVENPLWLSILLKNMKRIDDENSNFSARIFELTCKEKLEIVLPFLDEFCNLLGKVKLDGVVRPCSKICELLMVSYFLKHNIYHRNLITDSHLKKIIEAGFDWMITDKAVAIQAYTMQTLYLLGIKYDWIHPELALTIEKNIPTGSTGYKNRGRKVLKAIETKTPLKL
jgi:hypothetical protein